MTPATARPEDKRAARIADSELNRWYLDALAGFGYPADIIEIISATFDVIKQGDMEAIAEPVDFLGVNYYSRGTIRAVGPQPEHGFVQEVEKGREVTAMGWEVYPPGLFDVLMRTYNHYGFLELYVCENGAAYADSVADDGQVHDLERVSYFQRHLQQAHRAIAAGVPLAGYYAWSLMDNFEWSFGYDKRFGLIYVDYESQQRILKDSAHYYGRVIAANEVIDPE